MCLWLQRHKCWPRHRKQGPEVQNSEAKIFGSAGMEAIDSPIDLTLWPHHCEKIAIFEDICSFFSKSAYIYKRGFGGFRAYVLSDIGSSTGGRSFALRCQQKLEGMTGVSHEGGMGQDCFSQPSPLHSSNCLKGASVRCASDSATSSTGIGPV